MNEWIKIKDQMPPLGEIVQVYHLSRLYSRIPIRHCAWVDPGQWTSDGMSEEEWGESFKIKFWRKIPTLPNGKRAFIIVDKRGCYQIIQRKDK